MVKKLRTIGVYLLLAAVLTALAGLGTLTAPDLYLSDLLYQRSSAPEGKIVIIGIDERAMNTYGSFQSWNRARIAQALELLNGVEGSRPAVIAIDVLYDGASADPAADQALAEAAGRYGNVVTACSGAFRSTFAALGDDFAHSGYLLTAYTQPFPALQAGTTQGHINAMLDVDGILRRHMLYFDLADGTRVPSMALAAAQQARPGLELPPTTAHGFWYLPFTAKPGFFESHSIVELLEGGIPEGYFKNKIVLIGPMAPGLQDSYFTSIDRAGLMNGVEYQANAIQALLDRNFKQEAANALQLAVLFLLLLAAVALFWRQKVWLATALWLGMSGGWVGLCLLLYHFGWVLHPLWVPLGVTVIYIGCIAANYIQAAFERQFVTRTLERYVAPEIVSELMSAGADALKLGGRKCEIAVLFVDIRGFTTMSELLEPEQVVEILNEYLTLTTRCVMDNHGTLGKFVGDCTMAFWNAPLPQEDYVLHACRAAMAMAEGARPLEEKLRREHGRTISFGIGVHVGPAVVGNIGAPVRMDYTAIGDTVNTAARLEANAPAGTIYISRAVADALGGRAAVTPLAVPPRLKGKTEGFEILTLDALRDTPDGE